MVYCECQSKQYLKRKIRQLAFEARNQEVQGSSTSPTAVWVDYSKICCTSWIMAGSCHFYSSEVSVNKKTIESCCKYRWRCCTYGFGMVLDETMLNLGQVLRVNREKNFFEVGQSLHQTAYNLPQNFDVY